MELHSSWVEIALKQLLIKKVHNNKIHTIIITLELCKIRKSLTDKKHLNYEAECSKQVLNL